MRQIIFLLSISIFIMSCGQNDKSSESQLLGKWSFGPNTPNIFEITKDGSNYYLKITTGEDFSPNQRGFAAFNSIYSLTKEGNLKDNNNLGIIIAYDNSCSCLLMSGLPESGINKYYRPK